MADIIRLPDNFIGKEDHERLESFGAHMIAHGRATRWHWDKDTDGDDVFEIYRGGADEVLIVRINRDREKDTFRAEDAAGHAIASGALDHVMAIVDQKLALDHGEPA